MIINIRAKDFKKDDVLWGRKITDVAKKSWGVRVWFEGVEKPVEYYGHQTFTVIRETK